LEELFMSRVTLRALLFCQLAVAPLALAAGKAKPALPPKPQPAPALVDAFAGMTGTWTCKGKFKKPDGTEVDSSSTMVITAELDGFTYSGAYQVPKSDTLPAGMQGQMYWSYDSANKKLVEFFADSLGGIGRGTSEGLKGDSVVWNEDQVLMGQPKRMRTTVKRVSPTEMSLTFDAEGNGTWVNLGSNSCKKE
jgi:hypothetical protein